MVMNMGPAVGAMQNGTHKYFRRIFCNNYPVNYRKRIVEAIEGTPEQRRRRIAEEEAAKSAAIEKLTEQKNAAMKDGDYNSAMFYQNQINDLNGEI